MPIIFLVRNNEFVIHSANDNHVPALTGSLYFTEAKLIVTETAIVHVVYY